ncbi:MAG: GMC family oxidoreductase [Thiogranum sp.]|nr:GMC family oxidoreductase [Thiogranum sp.]
MFIDARNLPDQTILETDLAIIGGGVAGITLARALADSGIRICLVEAGGLELDPEVQALYEGENVGIDYSTTATRLRYFGGSSNHWGGYTRPLDPIDFEQRDWVPHSGWPLSMEELLPWYKPATELTQIAPAHFDDAPYWEQETGATLPRPATGRMRFQFVHFSPPTRFGTEYREELDAAPDIQVLLNANVTRIAAAENGRTVNRLDIRTLNNLTHHVRARRYVVAVGGLENARLLLLSNDVVKAGLGNHNDQVGRYFMEHPHLAGFAEIVAGDMDRMPKIMRERVRVQGRSAKVAFNPAADFLREERLLNATFMMGVARNYAAQPTPDQEEPRSTAHRDMLLAARRFLSDSDIDSTTDAADALGVWLGIGGSSEQAPNPDSRVSLSDSRDALDLPRLKLDWRLTEQDRVSFYTHMRSLALEFGALGLGRMLETIADKDNWPQPVAGGSHHMGTTRMSDDPKHGVVDRNCKVHDIENLYVAGSSTFPTSGSANPTLTLVALTLRLAEHLKEQMR